MINLGIFQPGDSVFYAANFHNDTGTIETPTSPEAQIRTPAGVWSALTAPSVQNSKTGHMGGTIDTTGYADGQYVGRMAGVVTTGKTVATEFCFTIMDGGIANESTLSTSDDNVVEGTITKKQALRIMLAALAGKSSGGGTTAPIFRDTTDAKNRITSVVDSTGNRTSITLDVS